MDERTKRIIKLIKDNMDIASEDGGTWWELDYESGNEILRLIVELEEMGKPYPGHRDSCVCLRCYGVPVDDDDVPLRHNINCLCVQCVPVNEDGTPLICNGEDCRLFEHSEDCQRRYLK